MVIWEIRSDCQRFRVFKMQSNFYDRNFSVIYKFFNNLLIHINFLKVLLLDAVRESRVIAKYFIKRNHVVFYV